MREKKLMKLKKKIRIKIQEKEGDENVNKLNEDKYFKNQNKNEIR